MSLLFVPLFISFFFLRLKYIYTIYLFFKHLILFPNLLPYFFFSFSFHFLAFSFANFYPTLSFPSFTSRFNSFCILISPYLFRSFSHAPFSPPFNISFCLCISFILLPVLLSPSSSSIIFRFNHMPLFTPLLFPHLLAFLCFFFPSFCLFIYMSLLLSFIFFFLSLFPFLPILCSFSFSSSQSPFYSLLFYPFSFPFSFHLSFILSLLIASLRASLNQPAHRPRQQASPRCY